MVNWDSGVGVNGFGVMGGGFGVMVCHSGVGGRVMGGGFDLL